MVRTFAPPICTRLDATNALHDLLLSAAERRRGWLVQWPSLRCLAYIHSGLGIVPRPRPGRNLKPPLKTRRPEDLHRLQTRSAEVCGLREQRLDRDLISPASTVRAHESDLLPDRHPRGASLSTGTYSDNHTSLPRPDAETLSASSSVEPARGKSGFRRGSPCLASPLSRPSHELMIPLLIREVQELCDSGPVPEQRPCPFQLACSVEDRFPRSRNQQFTLRSC